MDSGFTTLYATACQRILRDWDLTQTETKLALLIAELTYGQEMLSLVVTRQRDLAEALAIDPSTVCRAIASLTDKGALSQSRCAGELQYRLELFGTCPVRPADPVVIEARRRLMTAQQNRDGGRTDADGQMRLPDVLPASSEAPQADVMALRAMVPLPSDPRPVDLRPNERAIIAALRTEIARSNSAKQMKAFETYAGWWRVQAMNHTAQLWEAIQVHRSRTKPVSRGSVGGFIKAAMERLITQPALL